MGSKCNKESKQQVKRNAQKHAGVSPVSKGALLLTLVRPIMECACTVLDHYTQTNIDKLEIVQRRAARLVYQKYRRNASLSVMINN